MPMPVRITTKSKKKPISAKNNKIQNIKQTAMKPITVTANAEWKKQLNNEGFNIGKYKAASLMKEANIVAIRPKKSTNTLMVASVIQKLETS